MSISDGGLNKIKLKIKNKREYTVFIEAWKRGAQVPRTELLNKMSRVQSFRIYVCV